MEGRTLTINPTPKQYLAWQALQDPNIAEIHFGGAAGGGKTWLGCESRLVRAYQYPGYKSFMGRNELKRLMATTFITFTKVAAFHKIPEDDWHLNGQYNYIEFRNGSRIDLLDLAHKPTDPMYERLGSLEYSDGGYIDEASEVPFMAVDILRSRGGRHLNVEYGISPDSLYTYNPSKSWVYRVYKQWRDGLLPADVVFIQSLYQDNPFTKDIYGKQLERLQDQSMKQRLMFGSFEYDDDPTSLIEYDAIHDMFSNVAEPGERWMTADIARHGVDKTVLYLWEGWKLYGVRIYRDQGTDVTSQRIITDCMDERIPRSHVMADEDGIGGAVIDQVKGIRGFIANSSPMANPLTREKENYQNLKAQSAYVLARMINDHRVAIEVTPEQFHSEVPGLTYTAWKDMLIEELEQIKSLDADKDSKLRIVPKDKVKDALGRSPDFSDTMLMRVPFDLKRTSDRAGQWYPNQKASGFTRYAKGAQGSGGTVRYPHGLVKKRGL